MLEGTNGYCSINREVRIYDSPCRGFGLFRLLCVGNNHKYDRPCHQRDEENNHQTDGPTSPIRPRYDTITREVEYSFKN